MTQQLQPAGAGLPCLEKKFIRYILLPITFARTSREQAVENFLTIGQKCLDNVKALPEEDQRKPTLIKRVTGIEDSSRNWSALMTIEHLLIVGQGLRDLTTSLSEGQLLDFEIRIEDVKPPEETPDDIIQKYQEFLNNYKADIGKLGPLTSKAYKHKNPWFGKFTAQQWLVFNGVHNKVHLNQINRIIKEL